MFSLVNISSKLLNVLFPSKSNFGDVFISLTLTISSIFFKAFAPSSLINVTLSPRPNFSRFG